MIGLEVTGISAAQALLGRYQQPTLDRRMEQAMLAAARSELVPQMKAAAPVSSTAPAFRAYTKRGALRRAVTARVARKQRPAIVVGPKGGKKGAYYRHMVIGGTRAHEMPKAGRREHRAGFQRVMSWPTGQHPYSVVQHPGSRPNPFVERTSRARARAVAARFVIELEKVK